MTTAVDTQLINGMKVLISSNMLEVFVAGNEFGVTRYVVAGSYEDAWEEFITDLPDDQVCDHGGDITDEQRWIEWSGEAKSTCDCEPDAEGRFRWTVYFWMRPFRLSEEDMGPFDDKVDAFMNHTMDVDSDTFVRRMTTTTVSSNGFSHDTQVMDALDFLRGHLPEEQYLNLVRPFGELGRLVWAGSWVDAEATECDPEFMSWVADAIEEEGTVFWSEGEPFAWVEAV